MKKKLFYIIVLLIVSCGEYSVNHEVLSEGTELSGKVDWNLIAGTYLMDQKSLEGLKLSNESKFYLVINKDSTYYMNKYMDDDTLKIVKSVYSNKISVRYFYEETKRLDSVKYYAFIDWPNKYNLFLKKNSSENKIFIVASYFPDLSYDPNALNDLAYVLKYEKVSDEPMSIEELKKVNEESK